MTTTLKNKVALITGGSRGIGAAIAKRLAQEGADVAISYSSSPKEAERVIEEITPLDIQAAAFKADQANSNEVNELVEAIVKRFGRLDILVNNAGVYVEGAIDDPSLDMERLMRQFAINVLGVVATVRRAVKYIGAGGRIITIGSIYGELVPYPGVADYSATKAALIGYTKGWARDLGPKNITVNIIQPGPIATDMNPEDTDFAQMIKPRIPLGRYGKPEEVAAAVAFLASSEASYITSSILNVDGGFNA